jgi:hypothetical protein
MSIQSSGGKRKSTALDWLWLFIKVALMGAILGLGAGWLKDNVAPDVRWLVYPLFFVIFLAISIPLVFGVRIKIPGHRETK